MKKYRYSFIFVFTLILVSLACNLPSGTPTAAVILTATATANSVQPVAPPVDQSAATTAPISTDTPIPTPTPQKPLVLRDTLCWIGPGTKYDVVSALKPGTQLELIGRGTVDGWWVIKNPIYKDACWVQAKDVQIDPGYDVSTLKLISPPALPTSTPPPTKVPSPTPV